MSKLGNSCTISLISVFKAVLEFLQHFYDNIFLMILFLNAFFFLTIKLKCKSEEGVFWVEKNSKQIPKKCWVTWIQKNIDPSIYHRPPPFFIEILKFLMSVNYPSRNNLITLKARSGCLSCHVNVLRSLKLLKKNCVILSKITKHLHIQRCFSSLNIFFKDWDKKNLNCLLNIIYH